MPTPTSRRSTAAPAACGCLWGGSSAGASVSVWIHWFTSKCTAAAVHAPRRIGLPWASPGVAAARAHDSSRVGPSSSSDFLAALG